MKDETTVYKIQDFLDDPVLLGFVQHPRIMHYVQAFTGPDVRAMHSMLINKAPTPNAMSARGFARQAVRC